MQDRCFTEPMATSNRKSQKTLFKATEIRVKRQCAIPRQVIGLGGTKEEGISEDDFVGAKQLARARARGMGVGLHSTSLLNGR